VFSGAFPIIPGKSERVRNFARELAPHREEWDGLCRGGTFRFYNVTLQSGPQGDVAVYSMEIADPSKARAEFTDSPHDRWWVEYFRAANALEMLAVFDQFRGRFHDARGALAEAAEIFRAAGDLPNMVNVLAIGAVTAMSAGDAAAAARICGTMAAQRAELGDHATVIDILKLPGPDRRAREALGDAAFERESALGRALSLDEAVRLAVHDGPAGTGAP